MALPILSPLDANGNPIFGLPLPPREDNGSYAVNVSFLQKEIQDLPKRSFAMTFTYANLSIANLLPVMHGLNLYPGSVVVWDSTREQIMPDRINYINLDSISIDLTSYAPLVGTSQLIVSE